MYEKWQYIQQSYGISILIILLKWRFNVTKNVPEFVVVGNPANVIKKLC